MPQPFTYQHFIQAVQSFKDDMLMCYFDEAVRIYCNLRHISVGPRPASVKDFSTQYADAYEAANNAILIAAKKIGSYNPAIGEFRSYLHTSLENALKDILKADGYLPSSSNDIENEPDTTESDTDERVRRHKDDAFETMIRFIDTLPEIKRAAVYASAFGQVLRPDLKGYGRNYADILAQMYNTTALYIRQLATEGKQAAIDEVHRQGFNERSMSEVYMGALQVKTPARDINDEVLRAVGQLDEFQQFMLLRHLVGTIDENEVINAENHNNMSTALSPAQNSLLDTIMNLPSPFEGISKLADLEKMTGVSLVVTDNDALIENLENYIERIDEQIKIYRSDFSLGMKVFRQCEEEIFIHRRKWAEDQLNQANNPNTVSLLGLYTRKLLWFDDSKPKVLLFADNINEYARRNRTNVDNVFAYVFIHEMMHAYYDAFNSEGFPSREPLEEAFAEYGMLTFINKNNSSLPGDLLDDACDHVKSKIVPGPSEYGFGYDLFNLTSGGKPEMINLYKNISNWIDLDVIRKWTGKNKYFDDIRQYPKSVNGKKCFDGAKEILEYPWKKPDFIIQPRIRGSRSSLGSSAASKSSSSRAIPRLYATEEWVVTGTQIGWHDQYPLIGTNDLIQLLDEIIKVMKNAGLEASLAFEGNKVVFLGRPFSNYTTASRHLISESLCVNGTTVFPDFKFGIWGPPGTIGNIMYALSILLDGVFSLVHEDSGFVLYGPSSCAKLFPTGVTAVTTPSTLSKTAGGRTYYNIIDKKTLSVIKTVYGMRMAVFYIVRDYISKNPGFTLANLQRTFASVPNPTASSLSIIESDVNVNAYIASHPSKSGKPRIPRFFEDADKQITLSNGDIVMVSNQWWGPGDKRDNFSAFIKVADGLGYIIK